MIRSSKDMINSSNNNRKVPSKLQEGSLMLEIVDSIKANNNSSRIFLKADSSSNIKDHHQRISLSNKNMEGECQAMDNINNHNNNIITICLHIIIKNISNSNLKGMAQEVKRGMVYKMRVALIINHSIIVSIIYSMS